MLLNGGLLMDLLFLAGWGIPGADAPCGVYGRGDPGPRRYANRPSGGQRQGKSTAVLIHKHYSWAERFFFCVMNTVI